MATNDEVELKVALKVQGDLRKYQDQVDRLALSFRQAASAGELLNQALARGRKADASQQASSGAKDASAAAAKKTPQEKVQSVEAHLKAMEDQFAADKKAGLINDWQERELVLGEREKARNRLAEVLPEIQQNQVEATDSDARIAADNEREKLEARIKSLGEGENLFVSKFREGLNAGLNTALKGLAQGTMDRDTALQTVAASISNSLLDMAVSNLSTSMTNGVADIFGALFGGKTEDKGSGKAPGGMQAIVDSFGLLGGNGTTATAPGAMASGLFDGFLGAAREGANLMGNSISTAAVAGGASMGDMLMGVFGSLSGLLGGGGAAGGGIWSAILGGMSMMGFAEGGQIRGPGSGTSDSIPIWASNSEFITRSAVVQQPGALDFLHDFNRHGMSALAGWAWMSAARHSTGGLAGSPAPAMPLPALAGARSAETIKAMSTTLNNQQDFYLIDDPQRIADVFNSPRGSDALAVSISKDPARFRAVLGLKG